jgi:hypothetical protein
MTININEIFKQLRTSDRQMLMTAMEFGYTDRYVEWTPGRFLGLNITQPGFNIEHSAGCWVEGALTGHTLPFPQPPPEPEPEPYSAFAPFEGLDDGRSLRHGTD